MADIQHVVVLMLENRSFDSMLGRLYPNDPDYRGLTLKESNTYGGTTFPVWNDTSISPTTACIPTPDPGELFTDMNMQLFGGAGRGAAAAAMAGFAENYAQQKPSSDGVPKPGDVMHFFTPEQVPVISQLARAFGVCDCWHASAPCQTWPNRFFAHTGTALGHVDNHTFRIPFPAPSLFHRLEKSGRSWRVYFHDMPQASLLGDIWLYALFHFRGFHQFLADAHTGALPDYSFIEPRYFTDLFLNNIPNDEHPPHNVIYGEQLIAAVYNAVRSSPCWKQTLLIITCDEHGGCYDHVAPPAAIPPDQNNQYGFAFDSYGVRVPAVIVSPYIPPGTKVRPTPNADGNTYPFDHTSIIATVRALFLPGDPQLTNRDGKAPTLLPALSLPAPANDGPDSVDASLASPAVSELLTRSSAHPNGMQASLASASAVLPLTPPASDQDVPAPATPTRAAYPSAATAQAAATARTGQFLGQ
jgi:phospholipase C